MGTTRWYVDTEFYERPGTIELISIGLVADDGREYYAESSHFNWHGILASDWLQRNVRPHLTGKRRLPSVIADDIVALTAGDEPEFWGWYADYDWVVFCWLFGRMIDLPANFPKYCRDLKQEVDRLGITKPEVAQHLLECADAGPEHHALADAREMYHIHQLIQRRNAEERREAWRA